MLNCSPLSLPLSPTLNTKISTSLDGQWKPKTHKHRLVFVLTSFSPFSSAPFLCGIFECSFKTDLGQDIVQNITIDSGLHINLPLRTDNNEYITSKGQHTVVRHHMNFSQVYKMRSRLDENACISRKKHVQDSWSRWTHSLSRGGQKPESGRTIIVIRSCWFLFFLNSILVLINCRCMEWKSCLWGNAAQLNVARARHWGDHLWDRSWKSSMHPASTVTNILVYRSSQSHPPPSENNELLVLTDTHGAP